MQGVVFAIEWLKGAKIGASLGRIALRGCDKKLTISLLLILVNSRGSALAQEWHALGDIVEVTRQAVAATQPTDSDYEVHVQAPDSRLRLMACQQPLRATPTGHQSQRGSHVTVLVQCVDRKPWKIYVRATIAQYQPVLIATSNLSRNAVVAANDIKLARRRVSDLHGGYLNRPEHAIGQTVRRTLTAGSIILPADLREQALVKRGQQVMLVTEGGGINIRMQGTAMQDAARDARIRVRNISSGRIVEGTVLDAQTVQIR
ncbi:MAG: flagellar basal body P-ring formation chaperone FlgA [Pseudomonadota bacterium]